MSNAALADEVEALSSIYNNDVLNLTSDLQGVLALPNVPYSFIVSFPPIYPDVPPSILSTHHVDASVRKGEGETATNILRDVLGRVYVAGQVCLFDLIEEATPLLQEHHEQHGTTQDHEEHATVDRSATSSDVAAEEQPLTAAKWAAASSIPSPKWIMSEPLLVNKSTFVARCLSVSSLEEATSSIAHLLSTNKKVASATHNITAWRIKAASNVPGAETQIQDCDDDGETAAGGRLLHLMQLTDVWNVVVVVTRWYGGVKLGPERFKCINAVAREAMLNGGFIKDESSKNSAKKGKK